MNAFVKKFIEDLKYEINKDLWKVFFYKWYRVSVNIWPAQDEEEELFNILKKANIPVDWDARKHIIIEATKENIEKVLNNLDYWNGDNIPITYLEGELITHLCYDIHDIDSFIRTAASDLGLRQNANNNGYKIPGR